MDINAINRATTITTGSQSAAGTTSSGTDTSATGTSGTDALANEQTFLQLFCAQLQNQDPMNPQDGAQFVAQLAQFSSLEQELQMREDLDSIKQEFQNPSTPDTSAGTSAS